MNELQARLKNPLLESIIELLPVEPPVYLVGGAVRDALLGRERVDLDFVTQGDALKIARKLADELNAAYYPLDPERKVARIIVKSTYPGINKGNRPVKVDISRFQGPDLDSDLKGRDFTVNAMAVDIRQLGALIDPLHGAQDLITKQLRACSASSLVDDPVRVLRAVRFSVDLGLKIEAGTLSLMRESIPHMTEISVERMRDELFRILILAHPSTALRILDMLGALGFMLPEVCQLKEVKQSPPHIMDAWNHTLEVLSYLERVLEVLGAEFDPEKAGSLSLGLLVIQLGRYREKLAQHLESSLNPDRPHRGLLFLAGLYHDVGKRATQSVDSQGEIRFIGHDQKGSWLAEERGQALRLSNLEVQRLVTIVSHHMRPSLLSHPEAVPGNKAIYHFFRDTSAAGIDICLLSLADILATYGPTLPQERWNRHLELVRRLMGAWWEDNAVQVLPPELINGDDLLEQLGLSPGPIVGYLLEAVREAQVCGEVQDRAGALLLAKELFTQELNKKRVD